MWGAVEKKACSDYHPSVNSLKAKVDEEWGKMSDDTLKRICHKFRFRLERCIAANSGIFEK